MTEQFAKPIWIPVQANIGPPPTVVYDTYGDFKLPPGININNHTSGGKTITGIYFLTKDNEFGRITFDGLDAIKVCRGEYFPYLHEFSSQTSRENLVINIPGFGGLKTRSGNWSVINMKKNITNGVMNGGIVMSMTC